MSLTVRDRHGVEACGAIQLLVLLAHHDTPTISRSAVSGSWTSGGSDRQPGRL